MESGQEIAENKKITDKNKKEENKIQVILETSNLPFPSNPTLNSFLTSLSSNLHTLPNCLPRWQIC